MTFTSETANTKQVDIEGKRVGMLTAVQRLPKGRHICLCDCGTTRIVRTGHFNTGKIKSCGCHAARHGRTKSREHIAYFNMMARCHNPKNKRYKDYGARGVLVCERWRESFSNFFEDMGPCPDAYTIERSDNLKGYEPGNCEWATRSSNQRNRSISRIWTVDGVDYETTAEAKKAIGVSEHTIRAWCLGRTADGRHYPPKENCSARLKYEVE